MSRRLSYSEISTAQTCGARWDFSYGGTLAGDCLKPRLVAPILMDGRAWGAGVAAYHRASSSLLALFDGLEAMRVSIDEDLAFMAEAGVLTDELLERRIDTLQRLEMLLVHYDQLCDPLENLTRLEDSIVVPVPSRSGGRRGSNRYQFEAKIDGFTVDANDDDWLVEFKLRKKLQPRWVIELLRQYRWYAWARQRETGRQVAGIIIDERLNEVPRPPRILKAGGVSNDQRQMTTVPLYLEACRAKGQDPDPELVLHLGERVWQQRVHVLFRPGELEEAGRELVSAAIEIRDLDNGTKWPTRNASERTCNGCRYKRICNDPHGQLVDELFLRTPPKRDRVEQSPQPQETA